MTDKELRDAAVADLKLTTVGYKNKHWTAPPAGSKWKSALDLLAQIGHQPPPPGSWTKVADEYGSFTLSETKEVRYGSGSAFNRKNPVTGDVSVRKRPLRRSCPWCKQDLRGSSSRASLQCRSIGTYRKGGLMTVVNTAPPVISGSAIRGQTLSTSTGTWTFDLDYLTYAYRWLRCDAAGANCVAIPGQVYPTLLLGSADVGSTIRSEVTATEVVTPPPLPPGSLPWRPANYVSGDPSLVTSYSPQPTLITLNSSNSQMNLDPNTDYLVDIGDFDVKNNHIEFQVAATSRSSAAGVKGNGDSSTTSPACSRTRKGDHPHRGRGLRGPVALYRLLDPDRCGLYLAYERDHPVPELPHRGQHPSRRLLSADHPDTFQFEGNGVSHAFRGTVRMYQCTHLTCNTGFNAGTFCGTNANQLLSPSPQVILSRASTSGW